MLFRYLLLAAVLICLQSISAELPKKIEIGKNTDLKLSGDNTVIVVDADASKVTRFAAKELQDFLSQVLGKTVNISSQPGNGVNLYIGLGSFAREKGLKREDLSKDGFFIKRYGNDICIAGRDDAKADPEKLLKTSGVWGMMHERGTVFAVYDFLERFAGVRFYFPGELGTIVPKKASLQLPKINIIEKPDFIKRYYSAFWDGEYFEGENRKATINPKKNLNMYRRRVSTVEIPCTHGIANAFNLQARFFKDHPEYFALTNAGIRDPKHLCWSSPVMEEIYQDIKAYLTGRPAAERGVGIQNTKKPHWHFAHFIDKYVDIFPEDGMLMCQCEKCKKKYEPERGRTGISTELIWNNVINWAQRLKDEKIEGTLCMAAYVPYKEMPRKQIPDNVLLLVCDTGPWAVDTEAGEKGLALTKAWKEKTNHKVQLWNYAYKGYGAWKMTGIPAYTPKAIGKYYKKVAPYACGAFMESESDRFLYFYMNNYILCKVAWDNQADYEAILDEHYQLMYGDAAPIMQKIMEEFEEICTKQIVGRIIETDVGPVASVPSDSEVWNKIYTPAKLADITARFDKAAKIVKPDSLEAKRIDLFRREYLNPLLAESSRFQNQTKAVRGLRFNMIYPIQLIASNTNKQPAEKRVATTIRAKYSEDSLIFTVDCEEPRMADIIAPDRAADFKDAYFDNCVEILLNPSGDRVNYYHLVVTSAGCLTDYQWKKVGKTGATPNIAWNSGAQIKVTPAEKGFSMEVSIPLKNLPGLKKEGFPVNFGRNRLLKGYEHFSDMYVWSPYSDGFHDIDSYGTMTPGDREVVYDGGFDIVKPYGKNGTHWGSHKNGKYHGWIATNPKTGNAKIELDDKVFFSAPRSMKITALNGKGADVQQYYWYKTIKPNTKYKISYMIKLDNVKPVSRGGGIFFNVVDSGNNFFPQRNWLSGTQDWACMSFDFKTKDKPIHKHARFEIKMLNCTGTAWVDNISIEEVIE